MLTLEELKKQASKTEGPVCDPCATGQETAPEKTTTRLLTDGTPTERKITPILPRNPSHAIGATAPIFGHIPGIHAYNVFGTPLHVVVEPDGLCHYAPIWTAPAGRPDAHLGAVTGDC